jgi:hypothetical protein
VGRSFGELEAIYSLYGRCVYRGEKRGATTGVLFEELLGAIPAVDSKDKQGVAATKAGEASHRQSL